MLTYWETLIATRSNIAVSDSYAQLWGRKLSNANTVETYTGTLPATLQTVEGYLESYKIYGSTVQDGTPTPENPIIPSGCGERTGNLFNEEYPGYAVGSILKYRPIYVGQGTFTLSTTFPQMTDYADLLFLAGNVSTGGSTGNNGVWSEQPITVESIDGYVTIAYRRFSASHPNLRDYNTMLNEGSTPLPYVPYGYKLPMVSRTENLFDLSSYYEVSSPISDIIIEKNRITYNASRQYSAIKYKFNLGIADVYTISLGADSLNTRLELRYAKNGEYVGRAIVISPNQKTTVRGGNEYDGFHVYISNFTNTGICTASNIMLNLGSTALPYEPYHRTVTPIYLGEAETTRRIRKLVLTGEENWMRTANNKCYYINSAKGCPTDYLKSNIITVICSHYVGQTNTSSGSNEVNEGCVCFFTGGGYEMYIGERTITSAADFKAYLAQQYANSTPVTVWYILAEPETGIVNEPLMKIGDYADIIDNTQTNVQIPTAAGTTVIDYAGEGLAPSEVELVYKVKR